MKELLLSFYDIYTTLFWDPSLDPTCTNQLADGNNKNQRLSVRSGHLGPIYAILQPLILDSSFYSTAKGYLL